MISNLPIQVTTQSLSHNAVIEGGSNPEIFHINVSVVLLQVFFNYVSVCV